MGVSGCGKSTLSQALAQRLSLDMVDGDDLHLDESVAKMRAGIALQDADRWPWLDRIGRYLANGPADGPGRVVACSALRRAYRDRIRALAGEVCFLYLEGDHDLFAQRMRQRQGHYMQASLLDSQFQTLERPGPEESDVLTLDAAEPLSAMLVRAITALQSPHPCTP